MACEHRHFHASVTVTPEEDPPKDVEGKPMPPQHSADVAIRCDECGVKFELASLDAAEQKLTLKPVPS